MAPKSKSLAVIRIEHEGGSVNMAKLGQTIGVYGINIVALSKEFNEATAAHRGLRVAADVTVFEDKSFQLQVKTPATASLILRAAGVAKGSGRPNSHRSGSISQRQLAEIAAVKMPDLDTESPEAAQKIIAGTARSMGIHIVE